MEELLEAECGLALEGETPGGRSFKGVPTLSWTSSFGTTSSYNNEEQRSSKFWQAEGKVTIVKCTQNF